MEFEKNYNLHEDINIIEETMRRNVLYNKQMKDNKGK